ncbi:SLBB domain-containing protein [Parapedobacter sp. ISTM3]|uniref:SLBB domain-containing protein n=1 Tax=Parapedobacter sp. ISTM3 TaxID=2800130 RepID=UPI0019030E32|nr:SLBB domain-containing protein [Parapedobacter sp. ISTM3]MBK1439389.1 SLBB domain-containing protein [Parapedobacter sp. ISTM3]
MAKRYFYFPAVLFLVLTSLFGGMGFAQNLNATDLSQIRVEDLSDDQIRSYMRQAEASGLSEAEMERLALERGMPPAEIDKLRERVERLGGGTTSLNKPGLSGRNTERQFLDSSHAAVEENTPRLDTVNEAEKSFNELRLRIYGASLFQGVTPVFEPSLQIATPRNYVIGPGDQLLIDIYGRSEENHSLMVTPDGTINIPYVGVLAVAGMTIEQATERIRSQMATVYSAIRTGATKVNVALGNIRSIKVTVTGEVVKPGTYTLPSVANAFNALYHSGGPSVNGSFRNISVIRDGKVIAYLDIYDVLVNGAFTNNVRLEDQDILMVPPYESRIEFNGRVKRPAIFELKEGETFEDLLRYAGGFTEDAYKARVKVVRYTDKERRIEDVLQSQFGHYLPQTGDKYIAERVLDRFENRVAIEGAVFRPGEYELSPGLTLSMLIKKAEGLKEDAFLNRGYIVRLKDDMQTEQLAFNVAGVIAGTVPDIELKREDVVAISSIFDLREEYTVAIDGEIRSPGQFIYAEGMTLQDLIMQAGGFRESATGTRIEVSRRVKNADALSQSAQIAEVFQVDAHRGLTKTERDFVLMPFDKVVVRTATGYETQKTVRIEGEVLYPGIYTITRKDERISDLVKRAGGFTPFAYVAGASLKRGLAVDATKTAETTAEMAEKELRLQEEQSRMLALKQLQSDANIVGDMNINKSINNGFVGINLERIIKRPGQQGDLILEDGDIIRVPKELQTVKISGEVLAPSTAVYSPSKGFKQYISQAGGFSARALRKSSYVLYANGSVKSTNRFLFFNNYPPIKPGAEIFVPQKEVRPPMSPQQWLGLGTGIASLAAIILTMIR